MNKRISVRGIIGHRLHFLHAWKWQPWKWLWVNLWSLSSQSFIQSIINNNNPLTQSINHQSLLYSSINISWLSITYQSQQTRHNPTQIDLSNRESTIHYKQQLHQKKKKQSCIYYVYNNSRNRIWILQYLTEYLLESLPTQAIHNANHHIESSHNSHSS